MKLDLTLVRGGVANSSRLMKRAQMKLLVSQLGSAELDKSDNLIQLVFLDDYFDGQVLECKREEVITRIADSI